MISKHVQFGSWLTTNYSWRDKLVMGLRFCSRMPDGAAAGLIAGAIYLETLSQDLTWSNFGSDGGELITASVTLGVPHPPGYPIYVIVGKLFSLLPLGGTLAYRFNFLSAVLMSISVGFLTAASSRLICRVKLDGSRNRFTGLIIGLTFAFIPLVWSQAVIAEVYAFNLAIISLLLCFTLALPENQHPLVIGLFTGLAITSHLTSLMLLPAVILLVPIQYWKRLLTGFVLGLSPFLSLALLGASGSPISWGDPTTFSGWLWLVTARLYHPGLGSWVEVIPRIIPALICLVVALILAVGLMWRNQQIFRFSLRPFSFEPVFIVTAGFYFLFASSYETSDALVMLLPGIFLIMLVSSRLIRKVGPLALTLPLIMVALNLITGAKIDDKTPRRQGEMLMQGAPQEAIIVLSNEQELFTLWYLQYAEGQRNDLITLSSDIFQFDWFRVQLQERYPSLRQLHKDDFDTFISTNSQFRPVCEVSFADSRPVDCKSSTISHIKDSG